MRKISKKAKQVMAFLLTVCIVMGNLNIAAVEVSAEEPEKGQYTFVCKIKETNKEISDSEVKVQIFDGENEVKKTENAYELEKGKEYQYKITSTSSKFKGTALEAGDTFTAGTDKKIPLFVPLDKLNIEMGNKECYIDAKISMCAADDWDLDWKWESDNENVAKVDDKGNVTAVGEGTAAITKTSGFNSKITASAQVKVTRGKQTGNSRMGTDAGQTVCEPRFVVEIGEEFETKKVELDLKNVVIKEGEKILTPEGEKYNLVLGKEYQYKIEDSGITDGTKEGSFTASKDIVLELIKPQIKIASTVDVSNKKPIEEIKEMKKDSPIVLTCENYDLLYKKEDWECRVNNKEVMLEKLKDGYELTKGYDLNTNIFEISYKCPKKNDSVNYIEGKNEISVFDDYKFTTVAEADGKEISLDSGYITVGEMDENGNYNEKLDNIKKMEAGGNYQITVTGFDNNIVSNIIPEFDKEEINIELGDIKLPELKNVENYCGEKVPLEYKNDKSGIIEEPYYESWEGWNWNCEKVNDPNTVIPINTDENTGKKMIDLDGTEEGEKYRLTCSYNGEISSAIITVKKIHLSVNWDEWEKRNLSETRSYSKTKKYEIKLKIKNDDCINITEKEKHVNNIEDEDYLVVIGELDYEDGTESNKSCDQLNNVQIEIESSGNVKKYDVSEIEKELGGILKFEKKRVKIEPVELKVEFKNNAIPMQYGNKTLAYESEGIILSPDVDEDRKIPILKVLSGLMGEAVINESIATFNAATFTIDIKKEECCIENTDVKFHLNRDPKLNVDSETIKFRCITTLDSVYLSLDELLGVCSFTQKNKDNKDINLFNNSCCLYNNVEGNYKIKSEFTNNKYKKNYKKITFKDLKAKNWDTISSNSIKNGVVGEDQLPGIKTEEPKEEYYQVIFGDNEDYATTAAIIRILPEEKYESRADYPDSLKGSGGDYPVINLFFDDTAPEITFSEYDLGIRKDKEFVPGGEKNINEIDFKINNTGFDIESVKYGFCNLNSEEESVSINMIEEPTLYRLKLQSGQQNYKVDCPSQEGDYALYIKTKDKGGNEGIYISNGFFVDRTAPDIIPQFTKKESKEDLTTAIEDEKIKVYSNEEICAKFTLIEPHLKPETIEITITAVGVDGQKISELDIQEKEEEIKSQLFISPESRYKERTAQCEFKESANYTVTITAEDKVGLPKTVTYKFTVDKKAPTGTVSAARSYHKIEDKENGKVTLVAEKIVKSWSEFIENIVYKIFSQEEIKVTLTAEDEISPADVYYYVTTDKLNQEDLEKITAWTIYPSEEDKQPKLSINKEAVVYGRAVDKAGNVSYFCTDGMITDNKAPEIELSIDQKANRNNFYNSDIKFSAVIEDKIPEGGTASAGLQYVSYRIEKEGSSISEPKVEYDAGDNQDSKIKKYDIEECVINAPKFNNNEVTLYVTAVDNAGNKKEEKRDFQIDTVKPEISVTYDGGSGSKYYNRVRTATITIKERNLDTKDVDISINSKGGRKASIGKWSHSSDIGKSDDATHTCQVVFSEDDEYQIAVSCVDKAGNKAVKNFTDEFIIDTTRPVIAVSYNKEIPSQDTYFNEPVTATITITERNFDAGKVNIRNNAGTSGSTIPGAGGFSSSGDTHTATIPYSTDGTYGLSIEYTDEAGNPADTYTGNNFTVDLTEPEIQITNIENQSANKDKVRPVITCTDTNYDAGQMTITVTGSNSGEVELKDLGYAAADIAGGQQFTMDFPKTEELDDVYTLTAEVKDKAGNAKKSSIDFSVNRYGSVYTLAAETGEWLADKECAYIKEGKPVVILETNVDEITDQNISYMMGGVGASIVNIKESAECSPEEKESGSYFTASKVNTDGKWHQSKYEIGAANFTKEGRYTIQIDSTDRAGNHTSNVSSKHNGGNLQIEFAVDQTAPSAVVTGAGSGDIYNEETHTVQLDVQDNLAMDYVTVYLNGEEYGTYKAEDLEKMENGLIPVEIRESISTQRIEVQAMDMAGNCLGRNVNGAYDKSFDEFKILVTRNPLVRLLHKTWLLLIILLAVCCGIAAFMVVKRKKKQD